MYKSVGAAYKSVIFCYFIQSRYTILYRGLFMMLNNKQKWVKIQKREKKHHEKAAMQALRGPGELARRLEEETRDQPQRFLNKN